MQFISLRDFKNEEFWNVLTHFSGLILSLIGIPILFYFDNEITPFSSISIILFSIGLLLVYSSSSIYHFTLTPELKRKFQVFDHMSIYFLILGSYAPVCLITLYNCSGTKFLYYINFNISRDLKKTFLHREISIYISHIIFSYGMANNF